MAYVGWTLFAAGSVTGDESKIYSPFGTKPTYTDMQQVSFDNAGEKAAGGSVSYDLGYAFSKYGLSGVSVGAWDTLGLGLPSILPRARESTIGTNWISGCNTVQRMVRSRASA